MIVYFSLFLDYSMFYNTVWPFNCIDHFVYLLQWFYNFWNKIVQRFQSFVFRIGLILWFKEGIGWIELLGYNSISRYNAMQKRYLFFSLLRGSEHLWITNVTFDFEIGFIEDLYKLAYSSSSFSKLLLFITALIPFCVK